MSPDNHHVMSAAMYASPLKPDATANRLSTMILGAAEIDQHFNVNVTLGSDGRLMGSPGGHPDTAAGAELTIVTSRSTNGRFKKFVEGVTCITTPGRDIDVMVTERGIAVNSSRADLYRRLLAANLPVVSIDDLIVRNAMTPRATGIRMIGLMEYRVCSVIDIIFSVA